MPIAPTRPTLRQIARLVRDTPHDSCTIARAGYFVDPQVTPARSETPCPRGKHASGKGNQICQSCEKGKYAMNESMPDCVSADPGHYVPNSTAYEQL